MKTKIFRVDNQNQIEWMQEAAAMIREGSLVAFPTETVYGLGANALDAAAVAQIYQAKGRPSDNPLIVHVADLEMVERLVRQIPPLAKEAMKRFWPGPLTLVMPRSGLVPDLVTAGLDTVAVRMPSHPIALALIEAAGVPIAAPSANRSGRPSPTKGQHVAEDLDGRIAGIIFADEAEFGVESTVLDVTGEIPEILRPGGVTREMLLEIYPTVHVDPALEEVAADRVPKSPGQKYRHYAPKAKMRVVSGSASFKKKTMQEEVDRLSGKVVVLASEELAGELKECEVWSLGTVEKPEIAANRLFDLLRMCDARQVDWILSEGYSEKGLGAALMNRMRKAAGGMVIKEETKMKLGVGSDHGGYELKEFIKTQLEAEGHEVVDYGTFNGESVDYPDVGKKVALAVQAGEVQYGFVFCGTGIGISLAANKVEGIRCALVSEEFSARMSRAHNDANMLAMGGRTTGPELAWSIMQAFLSTEFEGGRHARRVGKIEG